MSFWGSVKSFFGTTPPVHTSTSAKRDPHQITITRLVDTTRQKVWDAWTKPQNFVQWFGVSPLTPKLETTTMDLRVGGEWHADLFNEKDGSRTPFGGTYLEVDSPRRLVFKINDPANPTGNFETITIILKDRTGATEMTLHQQGHLPAEQYGDPLRLGYGAFFDKMSQLFRIMKL
jgi:uncharacterized protein YndB with AHSA1/START domain